VLNSRGKALYLRSTRVV